MATNETNSDSTPALNGGIYRHKETGEEFVTTKTSKFGNPQAAAAVRLGFEYVGPAPANTQVADPHAPSKATPLGVKSAADLRVELAEAERVEAERAKASSEATPPQEAEVPSEENKTEKKGSK